MTEQASSSFDLLEQRIQRWIWSAGWTSIRDAQEKAIPAIVNADRDVIVAAATAAGKTEAAFLPILTHLLRDDSPTGLVLYISPLKALINDQFGRLEGLCESLEIPVWPWHGDISSSSKSRFLKRPAGVLLITPESLEAMLCNRGFSVPKLFSALRYIVIDELHAFIGSERGKQLQSLMQRIDVAIGRTAPRIGLSATLGDMQLAADYLRVGHGEKVQIVQSTSSGGTLKVLVKGYVEPAPKSSASESAPAEIQSTGLIAQHLFKALRGTNNLVFPNSRQKVEQYAYALRKMCETDHIPNEFWPHHGSLSRELRAETEAALKSKDRHTTAICTNTLELGIDIGAVKSIAQIGAPPSVASLRQRLGRSGRREGESAILRGYVIEQELSEKAHLMTELREGLFEMTAMVSLLFDGWFEPPKTQGLHLSTLVQQILSLIAQRGGVSAADAYRVLCGTGPFSNVTRDDFIELLRHLGLKKLIQQDASGVLLHGEVGEQLVNHYSFYAAFAAEEEYRVVSGSRSLGSLPVSTALSVGDFILFAARTWRVEEVDDDSKTIYVAYHVTGKVPPFTSSGGLVHDRVRQRMRELYVSGDLRFLDETAKCLMIEGRNAYARLGLDRRILYQAGSTVLLFTWLGDAANEAIAAMLRLRGFTPFVCGPAIEISGKAVNQSNIAGCLADFANASVPDPAALLTGANNLAQEKWDWALPESLLFRSFASLRLDIASAYRWLQDHADELLTKNEDNFSFKSV